MNTTTMTTNTIRRSVLSIAGLAVTTGILSPGNALEFNAFADDPRSSPSDDPPIPRWYVGRWFARVAGGKAEDRTPTSRRIV